MNAITFKYNGKIYNPKNPEKKLKQLGITWDDVEMIETQQKAEDNDNEDDVKLYYFLNRKTGYSITSIHPDLKHLGKAGEGYERCTKETIENYRN